jgi:DNA-entry nuclease
MKFNNKFKSLLSILCLIAVLFSAFAGCDSENVSESTTEIVETTLENQITENENEDITDNSGSSLNTDNKITEKETEKINKPESIGDDNSKAVLSEIPAYSGRPYVVINDNIPSFNKYELTTKGYETYASLDSLGRCGGAVASCGREIMPKPDEERGSISSVKPSGWVQAQYDCVSGKYLYNRCHLLGWQLSAENANKRNLITGTRYMNTEGMLPFENMVADYIRETNNHVAYRVTPIYDGNDLVASGVQMEAYSVEDEGEGICFNIYCYNVQPGVKIDYSTGRSWSSESNKETTKKPVAVQTTKEYVETTNQQNVITGQYVLNTNTKKIHKTHCHHINKMNQANKKGYSGSIDDLYSQGYTTCGTCF